MEVSTSGQSTIIPKTWSKAFSEKALLIFWLCFMYPFFVSASRIFRETPQARNPWKKNTGAHTGFGFGSKNSLSKTVMVYFPTVAGFMPQSIRVILTFDPCEKNQKHVCINPFFPHTFPIKSHCHGTYHINLNWIVSIYSWAWFLKIWGGFF